MSLSHSYVRELELLILDTLLPDYCKYQQSIGNKTPLRDIHADLLKQIKKAKVLPALFKPKEIST